MENVSAFLIPCVIVWMLAALGIATEALSRRAAVA